MKRPKIIRWARDEPGYEVVRRRAAEALRENANVIGLADMAAPHEACYLQGLIDGTEAMRAAQEIDDEEERHG